LLVCSGVPELLLDLEGLLASILLVVPGLWVILLSSVLADLLVAMSL